MEAKIQPWLQEALAGLNGGIRRHENEAIIGYFNMTTQGVLSASKLHFTLQQLTSLAHNHAKTFIGVVVMPNRAADLRGTVKSESQDLENLCSKDLFIIGFNMLGSPEPTLLPAQVRGEASRRR